MPLVAVLGREWGATGAAVARPRLDARLRGCVGGRPRAAAGCGRRRSHPRSLRGRRSEGCRRQRDLAARPGRPRQPRAGPGGVPARRAATASRSSRPPTRPRRAGTTRCTGSRGARPLRHARTALLVRSRASRSDVVYATSMIRRAALGASLARRPLVVKLVSDEVFERARRSGRYQGTLDEFQRVGGSRARFLRATRDAALRRARHVFCPSAYLREDRARLGPGRSACLGAAEPGAGRTAAPLARGAAGGARARRRRARLRRPARPAEVARRRARGARRRAGRDARDRGGRPRPGGSRAPRARARAGRSGALPG